MSSITGKLIAFAVFVLPLIVLGVWVWEGTPEDGGASGGVASSDRGALTVSVARPDAGLMRVTYANASARKITVVVPGRPGGVLRIVKPGTLLGEPRPVAFSVEDDARVELLPGASYVQVYSTNARAPFDVIDDARGAGLLRGRWVGIVRVSLAKETAGGGG